MLTVRTTVDQPPGMHIRAITVVLDCPHGTVRTDAEIRDRDDVPDPEDRCSAKCKRAVLAAAARNHQRGIGCRCASGALAATFPPVVIDIGSHSRN